MRGSRPFSDGFPSNSSIHRSRHRSWTNRMVPLHLHGDTIFRCRSSSSVAARVKCHRSNANHGNVRVMLQPEHKAPKNKRSPKCKKSKKKKKKKKRKRKKKKQQSNKKEQKGTKRNKKEQEEGSCIAQSLLSHSLAGSSCAYRGRCGIVAPWKKRGRSKQPGHSFLELDDKQRGNKKETRKWKLVCGLQTQPKKESDT